MPTVQIDRFITRILYDEETRFALEYGCADDDRLQTFIEAGKRQGFIFSAKEAVARLGKENDHPENGILELSMREGELRIWWTTKSESSKLPKSAQSNVQDSSLPVTTLLNAENSSGVVRKRVRTVESAFASLENVAEFDSLPITRVELTETEALLGLAWLVALTDDAVGDGEIDFLENVAAEYFDNEEDEEQFNFRFERLLADGDPLICLRAITARFNSTLLYKAALGISAFTARADLKLLPVEIRAIHALATYFGLDAANEMRWAGRITESVGPFDGFMLVCRVDLPSSLEYAPALAFTAFTESKNRNPILTADDAATKFIQSKRYFRTDDEAHGFPLPEVRQNWTGIPSDRRLGILHTAWAAIVEAERKERALAASVSIRAILYQEFQNGDGFSTYASTFARSCGVGSKDYFRDFIHISTIVKRPITQETLTELCRRDSPRFASAVFCVYAWRLFWQCAAWLPETLAPLEDALFIAFGLGERDQSLLNERVDFLFSKYIAHDADTDNVAETYYRTLETELKRAGTSHAYFNAFFVELNLTAYMSAPLAYIHAKIETQGDASLWQSGLNTVVPMLIETLGLFVVCSELFPRPTDELQNDSYLPDFIDYLTHSLCDRKGELNTVLYLSEQEAKGRFHKILTNAKKGAFGAVSEKGQLLWGRPLTEEPPIATHKTDDSLDDDDEDDDREDFSETHPDFVSLGAFFTSRNWPLKIDLREPVFHTSYNGQNGIFSCFAKLRIEQEQLVFYSLFPIRVPSEKRLNVAEFIARANYGMIIGNFEIDFSDGEVRYKSSIDYENIGMDEKMLENLVHANVITMDRYLSGFFTLIYSDKAAKDVIKEIEL